MRDREDKTAGASACAAYLEECTLTYHKELEYYGGDILRSPGMQLEKQLIQHGDVTVYDHSVFVAERCVALAKRWPGPVDMRKLVRGALLHDYFLYDWHEDDDSHRLHGFTHAGRALRNAKRDFAISEIEEDMIGCHMFPLNVSCFPKTTEGRILCLVDKMCATYETARGIKAAVKRRVFGCGTD